MAFFAGWQLEGRHAYLSELLIRTSQDTAGTVAEARRVIREVDSKLPILNVTTLREQTDKSLREQRMLSRLCGFFGLLALLLASIGLYGTMVYSVVRRTNEIGVRMAFGAERTDVLSMVLRESFVIVALGLTFGLPLAMVAARFIKSFLYSVPPFDPAGMGVAVLVMAAASMLAGYLPALQATKVDPMVALKYE